MLTDTDIRTLNEARTILSRLEEDARKASYNRATLDDSQSSALWLASCLGMIAGLAGEAEHAVFQVLNHLSSSSVQRLSEDALHNRATSDDSVRLPVGLLARLMAAIETPGDLTEDEVGHLLADASEFYTEQVEA